MKRHLFGPLLAIAVVPLADAAVVLDQEHKLQSGINYYMDYPGDHLAQTFTIQNSGTLAGVGLQASVSGPGSFIDDLHIKVTRVGADGFALKNDVLAEATIAPSELPFAASVSPEAITDVDLSSWQVPVQAGDKLAILFTSNHAYYSPANGPHYVWFFSQLGNLHPGGEFSIYSPQIYGPTPLRDIRLRAVDKTVDAGFRVYVNVIPEPSALLLGWCGVAWCYGWHARGMRRGAA